jgi:hypothetical protein
MVNKSTDSIFLRMPHGSAFALNVQLELDLVYYSTWGKRRTSPACRCCYLSCQNESTPCHAMQCKPLGPQQKNTPILCKQGNLGRCRNGAAIRCKENQESAKLILQAYSPLLRRSDNTPLRRYRRIVSVGEFFRNLLGLERDVDLCDATLLLGHDCLYHFETATSHHRLQLR